MVELQMTGDGEGEGQFHFPDCLVLMEEGGGMGETNASQPLIRLCPCSVSRFCGNRWEGGEGGVTMAMGREGLSSERSSLWGGGGVIQVDTGSRKTPCESTLPLGGGGGAGRGRGELPYLLSLFPSMSGAGLSDLCRIKLLYLASTSFR